MTPGNIPSLGHALKRQMPISLLPQLNLDRIRQYLLLGPMIKKKKKSLENAGEAHLTLPV